MLYKYFCYICEALKQQPTMIWRQDSLLVVLNYCVVLEVEGKMQKNLINRACVCVAQQSPL